MRRYFCAEWKKARKIQLLLIGIGFLTFSSFIGLGIYFASRGALVDGTRSLVLWGQLTFYNSTLLSSPMLAIIIGMLIIPEFDRKTLEMLKVNQISMSKLYLGKLLCTLLIILPVQLFLFIIFIMTVKLDGITLDLGLQIYFKWLLLSILSSFSIVTLQSYVIVKNRNFSKSVGIAMIGSILNFVLIFLNEDLTIIFPYSQLMIALRSRALTDISIKNVIIFLLVNIIYSLLFYVLTVRELEKNK